MVDETQETTTIRIKVKTHDKLKALGTYSETMDDIINRLMFIKKHGSEDKTETDKKIARLL